MRTGIRITMQNLEDGEPTGTPLVYTFEKGSLNHNLKNDKSQERMQITLWTGCETFDSYDPEE